MPILIIQFLHQILYLEKPLYFFSFTFLLHSPTRNFEMIKLFCFRILMYAFTFINKEYDCSYQQKKRTKNILANLSTKTKGTKLKNMRRCFNIRGVFHKETESLLIYTFFFQIRLENYDSNAKEKKYNSNTRIVSLL